jgi:hypothetical protein
MRWVSAKEIQSKGFIQELTLKIKKKRSIFVKIKKKMHVNFNVGLEV